MRLGAAAVGVACIALTGACTGVREPGALVPRTVDEDPALPQVEITAGGETRRIHLVSVGDSAAPVILVLHGSLADHRALRLFTALGDRYRVVLWDQRGCGLSERIGGDEYTFASIVEEIDAIKTMFSPDAPITLIGHSFGAMYAALYMSRRPGSVDQAVLIEPAGLDDQILQETFRDLVDLSLLDEGLNRLLWQTELLAPSDHETMDYKALMTLEVARLRDPRCGPDDSPPFPVWRPGAYVEYLRYRQMVSAPGRIDYDFATGLETFPRRVLIIGTECSAVGYEFQQRYHAPLFGTVRVVEIEGAGHRVVVERPAAVLAAVREYLTRYAAAASSRPGRAPRVLD